MRKVVFGAPSPRSVPQFAGRSPCGDEPDPDFWVPTAQVVGHARLVLGAADHAERGCTVPRQSRGTVSGHIPPSRELVGPEMLRLVEAITIVEGHVPCPLALVGGLAVLARISRPHRATSDLDTARRVAAHEQGTVGMLLAANACPADAAGRGGAAGRSGLSAVAHPRRAPGKPARGNDAPRRRRSRGVAHPCPATPAGAHPRRRAHRLRPRRAAAAPATTMSGTGPRDRSAVTTLGRLPAAGPACRGGGAFPRGRLAAASGTRARPPRAFGFVLVLPGGGATVLSC